MFVVTSKERRIGGDRRRSADTGITPEKRSGADRRRAPELSGDLEPDHGPVEMLKCTCKNENVMSFDCRKQEIKLR